MKIEKKGELTRKVFENGELVNEVVTDKSFELVGDTVKGNGNIYQDRVSLNLYGFKDIEEASKFVSELFN